MRALDSFSEQTMNKKNTMNVVVKYTNSWNLNMNDLNFMSQRAKFRMTDRGRVERTNEIRTQIINYFSIHFRTQMNRRTTIKRLLSTELGDSEIISEFCLLLLLFSQSQ